MLFYFLITQYISVIKPITLLWYDIYEVTDLFFSITQHIIIYHVHIDFLNLKLHALMVPRTVTIVRLKMIETLCGGYVSTPPI